LVAARQTKEQQARQQKGGGSCAAGISVCADPDVGGDRQHTDRPQHGKTRSFSAQDELVQARFLHLQSLVDLFTGAWRRMATRVM